MRHYFNDEFEFETEGKIYYVEVSGCKEYDTWTGRSETELSYFSVVAEDGTELDDTSDVYNEIEEYVAYDRNYDQESNGFDDDYSDEEEIPTLYKSEG